MKKYSILILISTFLYLASQAQKKSFEFGVQGAANINSAYGESVSESNKSSLTGFSAGLHLKYNTGERFGIRAQLQYEQFGWAYRNLIIEVNGNLLGKGDFEFKLNYINLPVIAEYSFGERIKFKIGTGVFFGLLVDNMLITKVKEPFAPNNTPTTKSKSDYRKSTNFGFVFSAGMQVPLSTKVKFSLDLRDNLGLGDVEKGSAVIKTNAFVIQPGFTINL